MSNLKIAKAFHSFLKEEGVYEDFEYFYKSSEWRSKYTALSKYPFSMWVVDAFSWAEDVENKWKAIHDRWVETCSQFRAQ